MVFTEIGTPAAVAKAVAKAAVKAKAAADRKAACKVAITVRKQAVVKAKMSASGRVVTPKLSKAAAAEADDASNSK